LDSSAEALLGEFLTGTEARQVADRLGDGDTLTAALQVVASGRRPQARSLVAAVSRESLIGVLRAIEGARSARTAVDPLWTMPGHLARNGRLTSSVTQHVERARHSVVCSTFNFQRSSGLWTALGAAARRPEITVRVYMDTEAASSPNPGEVAAHLRPGVVLRTIAFDGRQVRNHSKFISVDHRFLLVTSANFSWSAENANLELGLLIDNRNLAEAVELQMREAETHVFERVTPPGRGRTWEGQTPAAHR
jgi:phosphatidylserine/phosphatidylglycerophosphate/cardiolipin synthase-like enzyme